MLSGVRSKELDGLLNNRWLMDDTTGEIQVQLASDHQDSALNLGHVTRVVSTSGRADFRGAWFGAAYRWAWGDSGAERFAVDHLWADSWAQPCDGCVGDAGFAQRGSGAT